MLLHSKCKLVFSCSNDLVEIHGTDLTHTGPKYGSFKSLHNQYNTDIDTCNEYTSLCLFIYLFTLSQRMRRRHVFYVLSPMAIIKGLRDLK